MSFRSLELRVLIVGLAGATVGLFGLAVLAPASDAMVGSYYQSLVKSGKSKSAAAKLTEKAMKGDNGFYGHKLKSKSIPAKHGTLIWSKSMKRPGAGKTRNVLYSSRGLNDEKIAVSGTVMVPKGKAPKGGWPVISWAHGTTGMADQCAPSKYLGRTDGDDDYGAGELITDWLNSGYAVVATDYQGLGTPGIHPYLVGDSEGRGILDIVPAARQLGLKLSKRVVLAGHSQGGQAILFAAHLASTWGKGTNYLGTVAYAPASNLDFQAQNIGALDGPGGPGISALAVMIGRGMVAANSAIKPEDVFTGTAMKYYPLTETLCSTEIGVETTKDGVQPSTLLRSNWATATTSGVNFKKELIKQNPALSVSASVLIAQGTADGTVPKIVTDLLIPQIEDANSAGRITYDVFSGADHSTVLEQSKPEVDPFIAGLFGG